MPLLWYLRDHAALTGTKFGCGVGLCGGLHRSPRRTGGALLPRCHWQPWAGTNHHHRRAGGAELHAVQRAWIEEDVAQCGYCQAGQIMAAAALLNPSIRIPVRTQIAATSESLPLWHLSTDPPRDPGAPRRCCREEAKAHELCPAGRDQPPRLPAGVGDRPPAAC